MSDLVRWLIAGNILAILAMMHLLHRRIKRLEHYLDDREEP